jgi:hypothetical protein
LSHIFHWGWHARFAAPAFPVCIGDDVWIGFGCIILPGVRIGAGSVIGARSVVDQDIPSGVVACGNPARIFLETDPVDCQIKLAQNDLEARKALEQHTVLFTFGENLGTEVCPLATGGYRWHAPWQAVLMDDPR